MVSFTAPEKVTDLLCQLISIPSVNPMGRDLSGPEYLETRLSDWLMGFFASLGVEYERLEVAPGRDNVIARYQSPGSQITLLLDAHQDTVPVDGMTIPPFLPVIKNGRIYGRGSADVKGGLAAMLHAFRRIVREKPAGAANIVLSCTCDEEATVLGIKELVRYWQDADSPSVLLKSPPDAAIVAEPTDLDVVVAHRGVVRFRILTAGKACHSSNPAEGVNAIYRMGHVLTALENYAASLNELFEPHPMCGSATLSVGRIEGGMSVNIVPDACAIEVDRRVIPGEDWETVIPHLQAYLESRLDFPIQIEAPWINAPALNNDNNSWIAAPLIQQAEIVDGPHHGVGVPYCTHASPIAHAGVPAVVFGPGSIAQAHTSDEFIEIASLEKAAEVYFQVCANPPQKPVLDDQAATLEAV